MEKAKEILKRMGIMPIEGMDPFCRYFDSFNEIRRTMKSYNKELPEIEREIEELEEKRKKILSKIDDEANKKAIEELKAAL